MEVVTIQKEAWDEINSRINALLKEKKQDISNAWIDNVELMKLLGISKRTAQHYRDSGIISFSQVWNKIYYRLSDVEAMKMKYYKKSFITN